MLKFTIEEKTKREVSIPVPCFWKRPTTAYTNICGLLDENTFVSVLIMRNGEYKTLHNSTVAEAQRDIIEAYTDFNLITEDEFMTAWEQAYSSMSLRPTVSVSVYDSVEADREFKDTEGVA